MKTLVEYIESAALVVGTEYKLAKVMNVTQATISQAKRKGSMSVENCFALAKVLGIDPGEIIAACDVARNPDHLDYWKKWVAGYAIMAIGIMALSPEISGVYEQASFGGLYIMRNVHNVIWFLFFVAILSIIGRSGLQTWRFLRL